MGSRRPSGFEVEDDIPCLADDPDRHACLDTVLPLDSSLLPTGGVGSAPRTVRVRVEAPGGYRAVAEAAVLLSNAASVVVSERTSSFRRTFRSWSSSTRVAG